MNKSQAAFIAISTELVGLIVGALFLGKYLDKQFALKGLAVGVLCLAALILWVFHFILLIKKYQSEDDEE